MKTANEGDVADVPPICTARQPRRIWKDSDCAATSGVAVLIRDKLKSGGN